MQPEHLSDIRDDDYEEIAACQRARREARKQAQAREQKLQLAEKGFSYVFGGIWLGGFILMAILLLWAITTSPY